jgi:hypothetical protein
MRKFLLLLSIISISISAQVTTIANGNWSNPAIWSSASVPGNNTDVIINHIVIMTSASTARTITINNKLINNANILTVRGGLINNGIYTDNVGTIRFRSSNTHNVTGTIVTSNLIIDNVSTVGLNSNFVVKNLANVNGVLNSNGFLILYDDVINTGILGAMTGVINGNFTSQTYINRCNKWSYYSAPFNTTYSSIRDSSSGNMIYTGFPGSDYPSFSFVNTYRYITATGYVAPNNVTDNLNRGVGYTYWNSDTVFLSPGPSIPQQWKISTVGSINFNQSFVYSLSYSPSDAWNLVGNPYPGTIDWRSNNWTKSNISTTIYLWNTCNQNWSTYNSTNNASTNGASRYISPYQGFFVLASNNAASLSAPKSVIVNNSSNLLRPSVDPLSPNTLMISTGRDEMIVSMDSSATDSYDQDYDALLPDTSNYLYSLNNTDKYIVNVVEYKSNDTVDISVKNIGSLTFTGINTFANHTLYLLDAQDLSSTQLTEGCVKPFVVNGINETRFKIVLTPSLFVGIKTQTIKSDKKILIRRMDILGRDIVDSDYKCVIINLYDDGSSEKKIIQ